MHKVLIENASFYAYHGLHEEEKKIGGEFRVDLELELDFSNALKNDNIAGTADYVSAYEVIKKEMNQPSKLIEHLGGRIINSLRTRFSSIKKLRLKISKLNPPLKGEVEKVSILIEE